MTGMGYAPTSSNCLPASNPANQNGDLCAPFIDTGLFTGAGGTCGGTLAGYSSCTMNLVFTPANAAVGTYLQTFRVQYENNSQCTWGTNCPYATANIVGTAGLSSLAISDAGTYVEGQAPQLIVTATYSDHSSQNVTVATALSMGTQGVVSISASGQMTLTSAGSTSISATLEGLSSAQASVAVATSNFNVLGQPTATTSIQSQFGMDNANGVYSNGTSLFVADTGNNRVLIWNTIPTSNDQAANIVLGQANLNLIGSGTSSTAMNNPSGVYSDGTRLFVLDTDNNRVLIWDNVPTSNDQAANLVLGEPDMNSNGSGSSSTNLSAPNGVYSNGTKLFVVDSNNNRVLVWNTMPTSNGQAASLVLGQTNMTSNGSGLTTSNLTTPSSVYSDGTRLFVADTGTSRVLIWSSIPTTNAQAASIMLGQTANSQAIATRLYKPNGAYSDGTHVFVADYSNNRVLIWSSIPTTNAQAANLVLGQAVMTTNANGTSSTSLCNPSSVYSDGTHVFVADQNNSRVLVWNSLPTSNDQAANLVLGQSGMGGSIGNDPITDSQSMYGPQNSYIVGTYLFVADGANNRVLIWNTIPTTNDQGANLVLGQPNMTSNGYGTSSTTLNGPESVFSDGTHVFVVDNGNSRVLIWNSIPTSNGQQANLVIGEPNMTSAAGGISATLLNYPGSVYSDGTHVVVTDSENNRVLIWNTIPTINDQAASVVLGQPNMTSSGFNKYFFHKPVLPRWCLW